MPVQIRRSNAASVISMTPLIDVVFLLLIFFLVTSRFSEDEDKVTNSSPVENELDISLPSASEAVPLTNDQTTLFVTVTTEGRYFLDGESYSADQWEAELERARADNPLQTSVVMRSDQDAKYRFAVTVMDICKRMSIPLTTATDSD